MKKFIGWTVKITIGVIIAIVIFLVGGQALISYCECGPTCQGENYYPVVIR